MCFPHVFLSFSWPNSNKFFYQKESQIDKSEQKGYGMSDKVFIGFITVTYLWMLKLAINTKSKLSYRKWTLSFIQQQFPYDAAVLKERLLWYFESGEWIAGRNWRSLGICKLFALTLSLGSAQLNRSTKWIFLSLSISYIWI